MTTTTFTTHSFPSGKGLAVCIPADIAFPLQAELKIHREGDKIIIEAKEKSLGSLPLLFSALGQHHAKKRPPFEDIERDRAE